MVIDLTQTGSSWTLKVTVGSQETYLDSNYHPGDVDVIKLQSHWGSGVRFTGMAVEKYDEN